MALITDNLYVSGSTSSLSVTGSLEVAGSLKVTGSIEASSNSSFGRSVNFNDDVHFSGSVSSMRVTGAIKPDGGIESADANIVFKTSDGSSLVEAMRISIGSGGEVPVEVVFNESGLADNDFRIETDTEDEAFFVDSSANTIYVNKGETAFTTNIANINDVAMTVDSSGVVFNEDGHGTNDFRVEGSTNTHVFSVDAGSSKVGFLDSVAGVTTFGSIGKVQVQTDISNNFAFYVKNLGDNTNRRGIRIDCGTTGSSGTSTAMSFRDGDGTEIGNITFTGATVSYNAFTGGHFGTVSDEAARVYGTILKIDSIEKTDRKIHYNMSMTTSANDATALGVYSGELESMDGNISHQVYALGDGNILVCSEGGDILAGDYICSSNTAGHGMKQADDLLHSYTVAKTLESVSWSQESGTTKLIACTYHAG